MIIHFTYLKFKFSYQALLLRVVGKYASIVNLSNAEINKITFIASFETVICGYICKVILALIQLKHAQIAGMYFLQTYVAYIINTYVLPIDFTSVAQSIGYFNGF